MDYTQLLNELEQASLFDIYRLKAGMSKMLDQPDRINAIKRRLHIGMEITCFDERDECNRSESPQRTLNSLLKSEVLVRFFPGDVQR